MQTIVKTIAIIGLSLTVLVASMWRFYDGAAEATKNRIIILSIFFSGVTLVGQWLNRNSSALMRIIQWSQVLVVSFMMANVVSQWRFYESAIDDERSRIATISIFLPLEMLAAVWLATRELYTTEQKVSLYENDAPLLKGDSLHSD